MDRCICWHYTKELNGLNEQIKEEFPLVDLEEDIISIVNDYSHGGYIVFFWYRR
jgi:hypothetical protein